MGAEMSVKLKEIKFVSTLAEASFLVRRIAEPCPAGDSAKAAIARAHRRLKTWTHNRVVDVWKSDRRIKISADEIEQLRIVARMKEEEARAVDPSIQELRIQLAYVQERLSRLDKDFYAEATQALSVSAHHDCQHETGTGRTDRSDIEGQE
jgi:hypothetical protein